MAGYPTTVVFATGVVVPPVSERAARVGWFRGGQCKLQCKTEVVWSSNQTDFGGVGQFVGFYLIVNRFLTVCFQRNATPDRKRQN